MRRRLLVMACCLVAFAASAAGCRVRRIDEGKEPAQPSQPGGPAQKLRGAAPTTLNASPEGESPEVGEGIAGGCAVEAPEPHDSTEVIPPSTPSEDGGAEEAPLEAALPEESRASLREGWRVLAFGGGAEFPPGFDELVLQSVVASASAAEAAVQIAAKLEGSPSTNAGPGAALRLDGVTIECDALVLDSEGRRGFAGGLRFASSPVSIAAALYRAGGATLRGAAADDLAKRLGVNESNLLTGAAEAAYLNDLRLHAGRSSGHGPGSLESLYVNAEILTQALASPPSPRRSPYERLPIFVIVTNGTTEALAASSGGIPLSHPGAPSLLDAPHDAFVLHDLGAVSVLAGHGTCPDGASMTSQHLRATRSPLAAAQRLNSNCPDAAYLILSGGSVRTNIPIELLYLRGEGLEGSEALMLSSPEPPDPVSTKPSLVPVQKKKAAGPEAPAPKPSSSPQVLPLAPRPPRTVPQPALKRDVEGTSG